MVAIASFEDADNAAVVNGDQENLLWPRPCGHGDRVGEGKELGHALGAQICGYKLSEDRRDEGTGGLLFAGTQKAVLDDGIHEMAEV